MGEEGENGWKGCNFQPSERHLAEVMDARQGRFFLRVYDKQVAMLDGAQFRYLRDLREIQVNGEPYSEDTLLVPSAAGYPPTSVRFMGVDGSPIQASPLPGTAAAVDEMGGLVAAPRPEADAVSCTLRGDGGSVDIALRLPRIWWRMERDDGNGEWCSTPLMMTRHDFREHADANAVLRLRSPKRISAVFVGFGDEPDIKYMRKDGGFELPLADFVDDVEIGHRMAEDAMFNVRFERSNDRVGPTVLTLIRIADPNNSFHVNKAADQDQPGTAPATHGTGTTPSQEPVADQGEDPLESEGNANEAEAETMEAADEEAATVEEAIGAGVDARLPSVRLRKPQGKSRSERIFSPDEVAENNQNKYLGVLVAAKYARELNRVRVIHVTDQTKLTTRALEALVSGAIKYRLVKRRRSWLEDD